MKITSSAWQQAPFLMRILLDRDNLQPIPDKLSTNRVNLLLNPDNLALTPGFRSISERTPSTSSLYRVTPPRNPHKMPTWLMKQRALHKPRRHFTRFLDSRLHIYSDNQSNGLNGHLLTSSSNCLPRNSSHVFVGISERAT